MTTRVSNRRGWSTGRSRPAGDATQARSARVPRGMHGGGAAERGVGVAGQAAEGRGPGGGEGEHRARGADFRGQRPQVVGGGSTSFSRGHDDEQRAAGEQQGDEEPRGAR